MSQVVDKIKSITGRTTKSFKSNKYVKKLRSREEIKQTVKSLVAKVKSMNSVEAIRSTASELRSRLTGEDGILRHFKSKKAFYELLVPHQDKYQSMMIRLGLQKKVAKVEQT